LKNREIEKETENIKENRLGKVENTSFSIEFKEELYKH